MLLDIIVREMNHNNLWKAGGMSRVALILGFKQPAADSESGMWSHPTAGKFHDKDMPAIVSAAVQSYFKVCNAEDMIISVSRIRMMLGPMLNQLIENRQIDEHGPQAAQDAVDDIIAHLSEALSKAHQLLVDEEMI